MRSGEPAKSRTKQTALSSSMRTSTTDPPSAGIRWKRGLVAAELDRAGIGGARLVAKAGLAQQVGARGVIGLVVGEQCARARVELERLEQREAGAGSARAALRDRAVDAHDWRGMQPLE